MNPRATNFEILKDHLIQILFDNQEIRIFDIKPFLSFGIFSRLSDYDYFVQAKLFRGTITWSEGQDICPDTLYLKSTPVSELE